jgi:hypothetical protein
VKVKLKTCKRRRQERIKNFPATTERRRNTAVSIPRVPSTMEGKLREIEENVVFFLRVTFLTILFWFSFNAHQYASIGTSISPNKSDGNDGTLIVSSAKLERYPLPCLFRARCQQRIIELPARAGAQLTRAF